MEGETMTYKCKKCGSEWHNFWIFSEKCIDCGGELKPMEESHKKEEGVIWNTSTQKCLKDI
jgi:DNA-directed RNA polymerase subunit RPC12/RpoP